MNYRKLGQSDLTVSPLCFGGNVFGWTADQKTSFELLDSFVDKGFNFIDTADVYSRWVPGNAGGESETIIGNWLKDGRKRHSVVLATKVGSAMDHSQVKNLSHDYIMKSVDDSLRRLQTDYIDLYQSHYDDLNTPVEETLEAYAKLIQQGKVRAIGASNFSPARLVEALEAAGKGLPRYESLQPLYNLVERKQYEEELEEVVQQYNIGVISYYSLASGFLSGKYRCEDDLAQSPRGESVKKYMNDKGKAVLSALDEVAERHQASVAQVSLAWLMARPNITSPIVSATVKKQLDDIVKAAALELSPQDIALLNDASAWR